LQVRCQGDVDVDVDVDVDGDVDGDGDGDGRRPDGVLLGLTDPHRPRAEG
jgi:hypothetical protein